ncbi:CD99 antigen isoform X2 [Petaurus breviceps papuanus]|uniref:CD99 antigen isoform X2 n=1 Tax=Petaurus breviceps papuanus TaxID=3040969 RepID=UPI0036DAFD7C
MTGRWTGMPLLLLLLVCSRALAQDFDLSDALPGGEPTKKPVPATKKPQSDGGLSLEDALSFGDDDPGKPNPPKPNPPFKPGHAGDTGGITDEDLNGHGPSGGSDDRRKDEDAPADSPGVISGIVSAAAVALVGAVSSFIAYQKKKLCFKGNDEMKI